MIYTVQLDFFIEEDGVMTDEQTVEIVKEIFNHCNCSASNVRVIDVDD